jgi:hypothetical protein
VVVVGWNVIDFDCMLQQLSFIFNHYLTTFASKTNDKPAVASVYTFTPSSVVAIVGDDSPTSTPQQNAFVRLATKSYSKPKNVLPDGVHRSLQHRHV